MASPKRTFEQRYGYAIGAVGVLAMLYGAWPLVRWLGELF